MANKNLFNSIKVEAPGRSHFDLSHDVKLTGNMGNLIPILNMETVPGDQFNISADSLIRFAPLISPVMHRMDVTIHYFFVPNRILWRNWDDFISRKNTSLVHPYISIGDGIDPSRVNEGTLTDYLGIPDLSGNIPAMQVNAFPYAAYQKIYNEYYRDQNLIASVISDDDILTDGSNDPNRAELLLLRKRAWEHDYYTSALPTTQLGGPAVVPGGPVTFQANGNAGKMRQIVSGSLFNTAGTLKNNSFGTVTAGSLDNSAAYDPDGTLLSSNVSIQDLRKVTKLQEWLELAMRAGRRYKETIMAYFGVDAGDARLDRPEYITGVKSPVVVSEVLNTAGVAGSNPQGAMAGHGVAVNVGDADSSYFCREHGWIIGIMSVMPLPAYQDGVHRSFHRRVDSLDYYWPQFANIGEQEIYLSELRGISSSPDTVFGYVPRYSEYKYMPNRVAGNFRSSLDFWHCGRKFVTDPALNQTFIEMESSAVDRIFAVKPSGSTHSIYAQVLNKIHSVRPMPKFGTPHL